MKIWVDGDAAPREAKEVIFRTAKRLRIETILVANQRLALPVNTSMVSCVIVKPHANAADQHILQAAAAGDIAITADIPLAAQLVERGVYVIDPRGEEYHADNIASKLSMRDFMDGLRGSGEISGGSAPYSPRDKKAFAQTLDRLSTAANRQKKL